MDVITPLGLIYPQALHDEESLNRALAIGQQYAPRCLPTEKQAMAVAYYVAYLLAQQAESALNPLGLSSEREGDLAFSYSQEQRKSVQFLAKWQELNAICERLGSITVGLNE